MFCLIAEIPFHGRRRAVQGYRSGRQVVRELEACAAVLGAAAASGLVCIKSLLPTLRVTGARG